MPYLNGVSDVQQSSVLLCFRTNKHVSFQPTSHHPHMLWTTNAGGKSGTITMLNSSIQLNIKQLANHLQASGHSTWSGYEASYAQNTNTILFALSLVSFPNYQSRNETEMSGLLAGEVDLWVLLSCKPCLHNARPLKRRRERGGYSWSVSMSYRGLKNCAAVACETNPGFGSKTSYKRGYCTQLLK